MSFSSENFNKKLASLQETQDSIVTISQWVLFHHRHSKELANLWSKFIVQPKYDSPKKLSLLYLCNDVVQQARHKRKMEFITEFGKILPEVFNAIYSSLDNPIKPKVDRLINVWEQRNVFSASDIKNFRKAIELSKAGESLEANAPATPAVNLSIVPDLKNLNDNYAHLNKLTDTSQANLNQVGLQSKLYLPAHPGLSDNLPSPKIYISKLNTLEKLCNISKKNIEDTKLERNDIIKTLDNLKKIMVDSLSIDDSKLNIINNKLDKLYSTRSELQQILNEEEPSEVNDNADKEEEPSPALDEDEDDEDDLIPTYENDSEDDEEEPAAKKQKTEATPPTPTPILTPGSTSGNSTPSHRKSVAFAENIEIKEYDREELTEVIKIVKSDDDINDFDNDDIEEDTGISNDYAKVHKDSLELKHEHDKLGNPSAADDDDDAYDPASGFSGLSSNGEADTLSPAFTNNEADKSAVLDLLSKLR